MPRNGYYASFTHFTERRRYWQTRILKIDQPSDQLVSDSLERLSRSRDLLERTTPDRSLIARALLSAAIPTNR